MGETNLGLITLFSDFESNLCPLPFAFVFNKINGAVYNKPNNFFARNEFCYLLFGKMVGCVTIRKLIAEFVGAAFNARLSRPPPTNVIDGGKDLLRSFVYGKGSGVILNLFHGYSIVCCLIDRLRLPPNGP